MAAYQERCFPRLLHGEPPILFRRFELRGVRIGANSTITVQTELLTWRLSLRTSAQSGDALLPTK
jgi:hypothetical protein